MVPDKPAVYVFHPAAIDPELRKEPGSSLYFLIPVPATIRMGEKDKERLVDYALREAEVRAFPGLRASVRELVCRTPEDAERDGLYGGGSFGIAPVWMQSGPFRPQVVPFPEIKDLYSVGASVHPGGGVPIVMHGARLLAEEIIQRRKSRGTYEMSRTM